MSEEKKSVWVANVHTCTLNGDAGYGHLSHNGIIGDPKCTDQYTEEQLRAMGMRGLYKSAGHDTFLVIVEPDVPEKTGSAVAATYVALRS